MAEVDFYSLTPEQYSSIETKDDNALYFLTNGELYKGENLLSNNVVMISDGEDYPIIGEDNTIYSKLNGESVFWNGSNYTYISNNILSELNNIKNRIDEKIRLGLDYIAIIQKTITDLSNSSVTSIGYGAFYSCSSLKSVNLPNATSIGSYAFYSCSSLTSINLPNATSIGDSSFRNCSSLPSINLPNATSIGSYAFYSCSSLPSINLPNATSIGSYAFVNCRSLLSASLPSATTIGNSTFRSCIRLESISLPSVTSIGANTFLSCTSLSSIVLSKNQVATLSNANAFNSTPIKTGTGYIYVPDDLVDSYKSSSNWSTYKNQIKGISELP